MSGVLRLVHVIGTYVRCAGVGTVDWYICQVCWGWYSRLVHMSGVLRLVQLISTYVRCAGVGTCDWYMSQVC